MFLIDQEKNVSSQTLSVLNSALTSDLEVLNILFGRFSVFEPSLVVHICELEYTFALVFIVMLISMY